MQEKICSFCGDGTIPVHTIKDAVKHVITELVETHGITTFYTGDTCAFDRLCRNTVFALRKQNPNILLYKISSYYNPKAKLRNTMYNGIIIPALKRGHRKNALSPRNRFMAEESSVLLCYAAPDCAALQETIRYAEVLGVAVRNLYPG